MAGIIYKGSLPEDDPRYQEPWSVIMPRSSNSGSEKPFSATPPKRWLRKKTAQKPTTPKPDTSTPTF